MAKHWVWAPYAETVELVLFTGHDNAEAKRIAMVPGPRGRFEVEDPDMVPGTRYAFSLDGGTPLPDPRSELQPDGVHGPSCRVDFDSFEWTDEGFQQVPLASAVIYELHVGTFTQEGTFDAVIAHLPKLRSLGVTHIELMPVAQFPGQRGWGYDGVSLFAPHTAYGGPDGLRRLVDACHRSDVAVLLDVVYNHLGPSGNYLGKYGPYFTPKYHTPWGEALNFDAADSDQVRRFICDNALHWLRNYHIDGLRLDAIHAIYDSSATHLLEQIQNEVDELSVHLRRSMIVIAESDLNDPRIVRHASLGGYGLSSQWSDDLHHALHALLTGERQGYYGDFGTLAHVAQALRNGFVYRGGFSAYRSRHHGREPSGLRGRHFVVCTQNHDQVGNRAVGDRPSCTLSTSQLKIASALMLMSPFVPLLFMGEEWGTQRPFQYFTDHSEPELATAVRDGRRREFEAFGWDPEQIPDPQSLRTFEDSKLDWSEPAREPHSGMLQWYSALLALRRNDPGLADDRLESVSVDFDESRRWLRLRRGGITVACSFSPSPNWVPLGDSAGHRVLLASDDSVTLSADGVELRTVGVALLHSA